MKDFWPKPGDSLGHYRLVEKIDEGGMGAVFKAHEAALDRHVAIKVLSPQLAQDEEFVASFLREARAVAALNHPNIIQIYFIGQHDEFIYFAMEMVEGRTFDKFLGDVQKPAPKDLLGMMRQAAMGLQYANNHGVIHRDIKPSNLLLNELGLVKVTDFGLARQKGGTEGKGTAPDSMGTPEYMSPEEAAEEFVDHRSDIYSLGATLYHLLAGRPPFTGASGTEILMHHIHTPLPPLKKQNANVPQSICSIVEKAMAKEPDKRFQTYEELIQAIDEVLDGHQPAMRSPTVPVVKPVLRKKSNAPTTMLVFAIIAAVGFGLVVIFKAQIIAFLQEGSGGTNKVSTITKQQPPSQPQPRPVPKPKPEQPKPAPRPPEPRPNPVETPKPVEKPKNETPVVSNAPPENVSPIDKTISEIVTPQFHEICLAAARMIGNYQLDAADTEAQRLYYSASESQKPLWAEIRGDITALRALKQKFISSAGSLSGRTLTFSLRSGLRAEGKLSDVSAENISLHREIIMDGVVGHAETPYRWADIAPASLPQILSTSLDARNNSELYNYGILLFYQSFAGVAQPDDARRSLATVAQRDPSHKADAEKHVKWLDDWVKAQQASASVLPDNAAQPGNANVPAGTIAGGPMRAGWECLDISAACNADVISSDSRAATDEFAQGGQNWTTANWLRRNNIAGKFEGVPDDGRLNITSDDGTRLAFNISISARKDSILLGTEHPKTIRAELALDAQKSYAELSFLHASAGGSTIVTVELSYTDGSTQKRRLQILDWDISTRGTRELSPSQFSALATRSSKIVNNHRMEMTAETVDCDPSKKLAAITLISEEHRRKPESEFERPPPPVTAGIFAISARPASR